MFTVFNRYQIEQDWIFGRLQNPQSVFAVLGPQEAVQLVTQRAREALHDQRETARRAVLHQQGYFIVTTHQVEAAARRNFVNALASDNEAHNYNVQTQVGQLEQEADAGFTQRQMDLLSRFSQEANQALENQRENLVDAS